jgi:putative FmdB family regulatory protein
MPTYEFECNKCAHKFNMIETMKEHDKHEEKCPECGSTDIKNLISTVNVQTSKKS